MHLMNGDSTDMDSSVENNHEMVENENGGMSQRIHDLERKVLEQGDELVCLKATLAEALRRITLLESSRSFGNNNLPSIRSNGVSKETLRLRPHSYTPSGDYSRTRLDAHRVRTPSGGENRMSALPQRKAVHYQSTGSLHSDSHSSSSASPIPSPSPRSTPQPLSRKPPQISTPSPVNAGTLHKRWSSTGDFIKQGSPNGSSSSMTSRFSNKSLFNLTTRNVSPSHNFRHGTKECIYNEEDRTVKMYLRGRPIILYAPTEMSEYDITKVLTPPSTKLKLDWVYGYRGRDCRSNLYFLPTGEMVYFVAATVVLYNVEEQNQRHYLGHNDDVKSMAIHPNKMLVATGQCSGHDRWDSKAHIRVWNSVSLTTQAIIGINDFEGSVACISFSKADGGALLAAIDESPDHVISVWDWQKNDNGFKITETKSSVDTVITCEFHPLDRNTIVTCGKSHIAFWQLDSGGTLFKRMGIFDGRDKPKFVTCVAFLQSGETITGDSNGNLAIWGRGTNTILKMVKNAHEGAIFTICVLKDGSIITGGGKDSKIIQYDSNLQKKSDQNQIEPHFGGIRTISEGQGSQLLIGTTKNCILTGNNELGFQTIIMGHTDELWGLASHPTVPQFATAGFDKVLQLWDSMSHSILWSKDIGEPAQSVVFSKDGSCIIVGCVSGTWMIFDTQTREFLASNKDGNEPIQVMKFNLSGDLLAIGSRDNHIYVYQVSEDGSKYSKVGRCVGHSSFVTHLDWAVDNVTFRSNSGDYEVLYWNAGTCRQITQSHTLRDTQWLSNNCTLSFNTIGIWPEGADGTDINFCDANKSSNLMATADDFGKVKLYTYPVTQPRSLCHAYGGHSSHVTAVKFLTDDTRLISIGGKDTAVLQWALN